MSNDAEKELAELAKLVKQRNRIAKSIAKQIDKPAFIGNVGEYIAERVFGIDLEDSRTQKGIDGRFKWGALKGYSVNVKMYTKPKVVDINLDSPADFYLVLSGPRKQPKDYFPWCINHVFLFDSKELLKAFKDRGRELRREMRLWSELWDKAEIYPEKRNRRTVLSNRQRERLSLFYD